MTEIFAKLRAPFPPERVSWRIGATTQDKSKGMALAYIDARDVMERLDDVVGPDKWQDKYSHANGKTVCDIGILVPIVDVGWQWVWKADGAGDTDTEAEKGALSDAFKRAAVRWGIGRYLYDIPSPWIAIEARGKSYVIPDSERPRLAALLRHEAGDPAPQEPTDSEKRIFAKLKADLPVFKTLADMDTWRKTEANTEAFKALPQGLRAELQELMAEKRRELAPSAPAKNRDELRGQLKRSLAEPPPVNVLPAG